MLSTPELWFRLKYLRKAEELLSRRGLLEWKMTETGGEKRQVAPFVSETCTWQKAARQVKLVGGTWVCYSRKWMKIHFEKNKQTPRTIKQQILWLLKSLMVVIVTVRICYVKKNPTNMQLVFLIWSWGSDRWIAAQGPWWSQTLLVRAVSSQEHHTSGRRLFR